MWSPPARCGCSKPCATIPRVSGKQVRIYQAGSSEMFGAAAPPQNEKTPFYPRSPYAVSKVAAHWYAVNYREAYGCSSRNGILFNHESPRRGETFVTRKITRALGRIKLGLAGEAVPGNLDARRDWGYAGDYVEAMWLMLQQHRAGRLRGRHRANLIRCASFWTRRPPAAGWTGSKFVETDPRYFRPTEVDFCWATPRKARRKLGWAARGGISRNWCE